MIEADQATEPPPSADGKEAVAPPPPANPANTVPLEGQYSLLFSYPVSPSFKYREKFKLFLLLMCTEKLSPSNRFFNVSLSTSTGICCLKPNSFFFL